MRLHEGDVFDLSDRIAVAVADQQRTARGLGDSLDTAQHFAEIRPADIMDDDTHDRRAGPGQGLGVRIADVMKLASRHHHLLA